MAFRAATTIRRGGATAIRRGGATDFRATSFRRGATALSVVVVELCGKTRGVIGVIDRSSVGGCFAVGDRIRSSSQAPQSPHSDSLSYECDTPCSWTDEDAVALRFPVLPLAPPAGVVRLC